MPLGYSVGGLWRILEFKLGKMIECSEINGMFCGGLDARNAGRNVDCGGLPCEVSEGSSLYLCHLCDIFNYKPVLLAS